MSKNKKEIDAVKDNKDKQVTYAYQMKRYKKALNNEFYFEAMLIEYAMLEDRLRSFLFYIGALRNVEDEKLNVAKTKGFLRSLYFGSKENAANKKLDINQISIKENLIRATVKWAIQYEGKPENQYMDILKSEYVACLDMDGLLSTLDEIDKWRKYRNEVIHGLLNKNVDSLNEQLHEQVMLGMSYARFIDNQVKSLKKKNNIRIKNKIRG